VKKIIIGFVVIIAISIGIYMAMRNSGNVPKFNTQKAITGDIRSIVTATGNVNAVTTVLVGTQVSGTIKNLYVDFNSYVKNGQLLAQIDSATFEGQVGQARANLSAAEANVEKSKAALLDARRVLERNKTLFSRNLIAKSDLDTAETNEMSAAAQLKASQAQVEQTKAALKVAETNLKYTNIISPVNGMVISRNVDVGQTVAASFQTPTLFNIAQDLTKMKIDTSVDEADIGTVRNGQPVEFTVDAYPERIFKGRVSVIRNAPIVIQNVVTYNVVVLVQNPEMILKPGMTANVTIIIAERKNVLQVPNACLRYRPADKAPKTDERKGPVVWTVENNKPKRVPIVTGISNGNNTEILSGNLKAGVEVIVSAAEATNKSKQGSIFGSGKKGFH
jgi:HlyD family secretion protein